MEDSLEEQLASAEVINTSQKTMLKTAKEKRTIGWFKTQSELLEGYWSDFSKTHKKLYKYKDELTDNPYTIDDVFAITTSQYTVVKTMILNAIHPGRNQSSIQSDDAYADISVTGPAYKNPLPPIDLPQFSGKQLEWETFIGMFNALVHDVPSIPPILELQYLIRSLTGEAANRLKNLQVTADNYAGAWQSMQDKYDNKKILLATHMANIIICSSMNKKSTSELNHILDVVRESKQAIENLQISVEKIGELWLVHHIVHKLDPSTRIEWEREADKLPDHPTYIKLLTFLESSIRVMEAARPTPATTSQQGSDSKSKGNLPNKSGKISAHTTDTQLKTKANERLYPCCEEKHSIYACLKYESMQQPQRLEFAKQSKLCLSCLQKSHFLKDCPSTKRCLVCQAKHHTSLHKEQPNPISNSPKNASTGNASPTSRNDEVETLAPHFSSKLSANKTRQSSSALLATARVILADQHGNQISVRALIDPGSERSFVKESALHELSPRFSRTALTVIGVGAVVAFNLKNEAGLILKSNLDENFSLEFSPLVMPKLTKLLPKVELKYKSWPHIQHLTLADPTFHKPSDVDCILGAEVHPMIILDGLVKGPTCSPMAQHTVFSWVLTGLTQQCNSSSDSSIQIYHTYTESTLDSLVEKFWEIENLPETRILTPHEQLCEDYFKKTTYRDSSGRFVVRLPFSKKIDFQGSRDIAVGCLLRSEKRLLKNPVLEQKYSEFMREYLELCHMEPVPSSELARDSYYMPHHAVLRPENPEKIRVVFNVSQKAVNKISLNDTLLSGPKLQKDISTVLTSRRFYQFAFVSDIVKMFRQILVHNDDVNWQRVVWRSSPDQKIQDYRALTVTYGTTPAPFLALRVLHELAPTGKASYPDAALILDRQTYVDDLFGGGDDLDTAILRRDQLIQLMASACMDLGKWSSNDPLILQGLTIYNNDEVSLKVDDVVSTLGLKWNPLPDEFSFKASLTPVLRIATKRSILSDVAKLFDPLGWLAPILITAEIILQDLWIEKYDWDATVQGQVLEQWLQFRASLNHISKIKIPRWLGGTEQANSWIFRRLETSVCSSDLRRCPQ